MHDVPANIQAAADLIAEYFASRGILAWSLGDVRSAHQPLPVTRETVIDASMSDLFNAIRHRDNPPPNDAPERWLNAAGLQLGLVCLGGRTARLVLLNGHHLRVTLERSK